MGRCSRWDGTYVGDMSGLLLVTEYTCGKWGCKGCRVKNAEDRVAVIEREVKADKLYWAFLPSSFRLSVLKQVKKRTANAVMVSFEDDDSSFFVLADKQLTTRTNRYKLAEMATESALTFLKKLVTGNTVKRYLGYNKWRYVGSSRNTQIGKAAEPEKMQEALIQAMLKRGMYIPDIVEADDRLTETQKRVGYVEDEEVEDWT